VIWDGVALEGTYRRFDVQVDFDVQESANSAFDISVELISVDTKSAHVDEGMGGTNWFDYKKHPVARFRSAQVRALGGGSL
jgi:polyisoprenoid-binding protein YceI